VEYFCEAKPQKRDLQTVQHAKRASCNALLRDIAFVVNLPKWKIAFALPSDANQHA